MGFSHLTSVALSDVGRKRKSNEDSILRMPEAGVFGVADGMGGAAGGELASRWTVEAIQRTFKSGAGSPQKTAHVRSALNEASRRIKAMAEEQGVLGTGTTAVVLFFDDYQPDQATVLHAGDSRAYRIRDGLLECLTLDHSLAAKAGLPHDGFLPSMFRGIITRAIGLDDKVELDEAVIQIKAGDCYLLCSDGLSKMLTDSETQNLIHKTSCTDLQKLAATLVDAANAAGGEDNISVVLVSVGALPPSRPRPALPSDASTMENKAETAEAIAPVAGPGQPGASVSAGPGTTSPRQTETEDVLIGTTPQTGHGITPSTPTATRHPGGILPSSMETPGRKRTRPLLSRRSVLVTAVILIALATAVVVKMIYQHSQVPAVELSESERLTAGGFLNRIRGDENIIKWTAERNQALREAGYAATALDEYRSAVATLCAQSRLPLPPETAPLMTTLNTAEARADAYCIQRLELQKHLRFQIETFVNDYVHELKIFGDSPQAVAESLRRFAGLPARPTPYPFESLQHDLQLVARWLTEDRQRPIPLEEIRSGPPSVLPRILAQRNEVWLGILEDIEACGPVLEQRQAATPDDALLNNLASLQHVIMKNAQALRAREGAGLWPGQDTLPTLEGFFSRVGQRLNRAPTAAPAGGEVFPVSRE